MFKNKPLPYPTGLPFAAMRARLQAVALSKQEMRYNYGEDHNNLLHRLTHRTGYYRLDNGLLLPKLDAAPGILVNPTQRRTLARVLLLIVLAQSEPEEELRQAAMEEAARLVRVILRERGRVGWWVRFKRWISRLWPGR